MTYLKKPLTNSLHRFLEIKRKLKKLMRRGFTTNRYLFKTFEILRPVLQTRVIMVTSGEVVENLERLEKRAVEVEETVALLKSQLLFLQKAAEKNTKSVGIKDRISALKQENERLKQEADKLKSELEYWEVRNGLRQVSLPNVMKGIPSGSLEKVEIQAAEQAEVKPEKEPEQQPEKKPKKEKVKKKGKEKKPDSEEPASSSEPDVSRIDFCVGKILSAKRHPDADALYVEEIDVGEEMPRTVCSGLVGSAPLEELQDSVVVVMCNLKPVKMRGVTSQAMVMCAVSEDRKFFELLAPPGSVPGDRVVFDGYPGEPDKQLNPKKVWDKVKPHLWTNDAGVACYKDVPFTVPGKGVCTSRKLFKAPIR